MSRGPQFRQVRRTVYAIKRAYGRPVQILRTKNDTLDINTGRQSADVDKVNVRRAVILPANNLRSFAYDLSFIAGNRNFTYGGFYDHKTQLVIVDWRDVPATFTVDNNCYMIVSDKRVEVKNFLDYPDEEVLLFATDGLRNQARLDVNSESVSDGFNVTGSGVDS